MYSGAKSFYPKELRLRRVLQKGSTMDASDVLARMAVGAPVTITEIITSGADKHLLRETWNEMFEHAKKLRGFREIGDRWGHPLPDGISPQTHVKLLGDSQWDSRLNPIYLTRNGYFIVRTPRGNGHWTSLYSDVLEAVAAVWTFGAPANIESPYMWFLYVLLRDWEKSLQEKMEDLTQEQDALNRIRARL